ncbi:hypothetical protein SUGI_0891430 [Cryptomeria japonica]|nr:hypothetical protein SUGI_0891430 [Cryptomeria japonica]
MPSKLARLMSPLNHDEAFVLANEAAEKGLQATVDLDNNICQRAGLLCEKSQISKMSDCDDEKPHKRRKLLDLVQDGLVTGNCGKQVVPDDVEGKQLHSDLFRVKEITTVGEKLFFPDFHDNSVSENVSFLPHKIAQNVPFHSQKLMSLVEAFHIPPTGSELLIQEMASTLNIWEAPPSSIETRRCVISIESMAEFVSSVIANHSVGMVEGSVSSTTKLSNSVVTVKAAKLLSPTSLKHVACHSMIFPFRVYYCHYVKSTEMYLVALEDEKSGVVQTAECGCRMSYGYKTLSSSKPLPA